MAAAAADPASSIAAALLPRNDMTAFAPLAPSVTGPVPPPGARLIEPAMALHLPLAAVRQGPRMPAPVGTVGQAPVRPSADIPPLASDSGVSRPERPLLAAGPLAYVPPRDPSRVPLVVGGSRPDAARSTIVADPTENASRARALAAAPPLRDRQAPPLRLSVPDPFEFENLLALRRPPADADPPAPCFARPARPTLPAQ